MAEPGKSNRKEQPTGEWWRALSEPAATVLTGAAAAPVAGIGGLLSLLAKRDPKAAAEVVQRLQSEMTYEPRTVQGEAGMAALGAATEPINRLAELPGKTLGQVGAPATGALTTGALSVMFPGRRMTAYHGSPHTYAQVRDEYIGTGEGAAAFGHGHYASEEPMVATEYRDNLGGHELHLNEKPLNNIPGTARQYLQRHGGSVTNALDEIENYAIPNTLKIVDNTPALDQRSKFNHKALDLYDARDYLQKLWDEGAEVKLKPTGRLYTWEIPHEDHMLDWDTPLREQPKDVRTAVMKGMIEHKWPRAKIQEVLQTATGQQALQYLMPSGDKIQASQTLRKHGVPGIRYLDRFSRSAGEGTRNYVTFSEEDIDVKHMESQGGLVRFARGGRAAMPSKTPKQAKFMRAVAHGWKPNKRKHLPSVKVAREFMRADQAKKHMAQGGLAMAYGGMAGAPALLRRLQEQQGQGTDEPTTLQPYTPLPAPTSGFEHGEPGSVARMLWDKYQIVDPTATNYDQFKPVMEDPYRHMAVDDPTRIQYQQWDREQRGGLPPGVTPSPAAAPGGANAPGSMYGTLETGSPYRDRLAAHQARIRDILKPGAARGGPVRMAMGGGMRVGPSMPSGGLSRAAVMPGAQEVPTPGVGMQARPMVPPMGGPRVPPNLQGYLQKLRMMARPPQMGQARQGAIGSGDQQGGLARALQSQTGRPPISRRMAFPGTR